ncbi:TonB-dependent receptor [Novosphingobium sp.]|uniref:TonB-dependent receptor n=1 Tax=Novosphingobium sp. TaxID=1874826 RepID=UPI0025E4AA53|nr:TonB-dependent receptor [Novosphingobium sp.]
MRGKLTLLAGVCAGAIAFPAYAQEANNAPDSSEIVVTAQRSSERLQDVPIAVSAFNTEALERQQIKNTSDLQLTLPNVTFTKTNFTSASFTIRGIGDLCVGVTCDSATAIHMNDAPLFGTRLFEGEFYDIGQIEVLRGPQGTLFGRNATSGVVNIKSARPQLGDFGAGAEIEYGNYDSMKVKGMVNIPVGESLAVRLAGFYLKRDGYTQNLYDNSRIDDRNMYGLRGSLRFEPGSGTTIDIVAQYFREDDNRMRIQKQLCQRDPTGILGCLNATRDYQFTNGNSTLGTIFASQEFFRIRGVPSGQTPLTPNFSVGSLYGPDVFGTAVNPADPRVVNTAFTPNYYTSEWIVQGSINQELGDSLNLKVSGNWQKVNLDSQQDYNNAAQSRAPLQNGLNNLAAAAAGTFGPGLQAYLAPIAARLIPNGPAGVLCTSASDPNLVGVFGAANARECSMNPLAFDRSVNNHTNWTAEAILSSNFDGPLNFLLGGIYGKYHLTENSYYVSAFGLDYAAGILGALGAAGAGIPPGANSSYFLGSPMYRNNSDDLKIKTYGIFGEVYYKFSDDVKLTVGARYNNDEKDIKARTSLFVDAVGNSVLVPTGAASLNNALGYAGLDYDAGLAGPQEFAIRNSKFSAWTGRAVIDWNITSNNLLYASYSRGYKSGGINPPLSPIFAVSETFNPEFVDAFEIGSKNTFANGKLQLNLTGFYYKYKDLQLSRIVARTSVNDNVSANIWGLEAEAVVRPVPELTINLSASYLNTSVSEDKLLANPRDFGAGRSDAVIIKDITNAANCAVGSNTGSAAAVNGYVNQVNTLINGGIPGVTAGANLQPTTSFGANSGIASTGAYSICAVLNALAPSVGAAFGGVTVALDGFKTNIRGNKLPGAPDVKFSAGVQYAAPLGNDLTLTPRFDITMTGETTGNIFNGPVNAIDAFVQANAQIQLDGQDKKWFLRGWIQNIFDEDSVTGLYVTDQSSGNFTNIFTLEPRRYGVTAGIKF